MERHDIRLTRQRLKLAVKVLNDIIDICNDCLNNDMSWNQACRTKHLNALKTRRMVSSLDSYTGFEPSIDDMEIKIYDGYENFYKDVFDDKTLTPIDLPFDYKESVAYVLKNTGLNDRESLILMRVYGIVDYDTKETLDAVGNDLNITKSRVHAIKNAALHKCRYEPRISVLMKGFEIYSVNKY